MFRGIRFGNFVVVCLFGFFFFRYGLLQTSPDYVNILKQPTMQLIFSQKKRFVHEKEP